MNPKNIHLPPYLGLIFESLQKNLITEQKLQSCRGWKGPGGCLVQPLLRAGPTSSQEPAAQGLAQASSEFLQGPWLHRLSGQLVPVFDLTFWRISALYWTGISLVSTCKIKKISLMAIRSLKNCKRWQIPTPQHRDRKVEEKKSTQLNLVNRHTHDHSLFSQRWSRYFSQGPKEVLANLELGAVPWGNLVLFVFVCNFIANQPFRKFLRFTHWILKIKGSKYVAWIQLVR